MAKLPMKKSKICLIICAGLALLTIKKFLSTEAHYEIINQSREGNLQQLPVREPSPSPVGRRYQGKASYYDGSYCEKFNPRCNTVSGEVFDETDFTLACLGNFPFGTAFKISYQERSVIARCNDRGGFESKGRIADLSKKIFSELSPLETGVIEIEMEELK